MEKHCSTAPQSISKQQDALLGAAEEMQYWLWQLFPQGGGLSHKLIERSHMIGEFHLEPSRYIKPHRNEEFTEVPLHFPKSPQITCVIVTLCPLLPRLCTSPLKLPGKASLILVQLPRLIVSFIPFQSMPYISCCPFGLQACENMSIPKILLQSE